MRFNDAVFGVVLLLAAGAIFVVARGFPGMPGQDFGPALFPDLIAAGFVVCGGVLIYTGMRRPEFQGAVELGEWARSGGHLIDIGLVIGGLVVLIAVWDRVGFLIAATLLTGGLVARFRGGRVVGSFVGALVACLIIDWIFRRVLLVPLPLGPLTGIVW
ncbi:MAG: tripartite tricarboxylate transporter TctB family protein [Geminicoccaceae bacterium]